MIKTGLSTKALLCALLFVAASSLFAQIRQPFSADISITGEDKQRTGKLYFSAPKMRVEMSVSKDANPNGDSDTFGNGAIIVDGAARIGYMLIPRERVYMELHEVDAGNVITGMPDLRQLGNAAGSNADICSNRPRGICKKLGAETVNGRTCEKWEMTEEDSGKITVWMDQKLDFPVKILKAGGGLMELINIEEGPQNASLFTVPAGYKPLKFPAGAKKH